MKCPKCGELMPEGVKFCTECGAKIPVPQQTQPNVRYEEQRAATDAGAARSASPYRAPVDGEPQPQTYAAPTQTQTGEPLPRMKWFKFLVNFALWASAVLGVWNSVRMLTGLIYGSDAELVYSFLPTLRVYDLAYGVLLLACAAFAVFTRFQLARFRKNGPACLYTLYIAQEVLAIAYAAVVAAMIGDSSTLSDTLVSTVTVVVMLIINVNYFRKRRHLFVN